MSATIYHSLIAYTPSADSEAVGYPDDNLSLRPVRRPWRSDPLTDSPSPSPVTISLEMVSSQTVAGIIIWDTNVADDGIELEYSTNGSSWSTAIAVTVAANAAGRRYGMLALNVTAKYLRLTVYGDNTGTPSYPTSDDANNLEIGRICIFAETLTMPFTNPLSVSTQYPSSRTDLVNGRKATVSTGEPFTEITLTSSGFPYRTYAYDDLRSALQSGPVALDTECYGVFLVEESNEQFDRSFEELRGSYTFQVREVV